MEYRLKKILQDKGYIRGPFGSSLKRNELKSTGIPVYEQQHAIYATREFRYYIDEEKYSQMKRFTVKPKDLIISCSGTIGKVDLISEKDPIGIISQALLILRANTDIVLPEYLFYFLKSDYGYNSIISRSMGSVQVNIAKREVIENIKINIPSLKEQKKIVKILSNIDEKIKLNNQINDNLYEILTTLYKETLNSTRNSEEKTLDEFCNIFTGKKNANEFNENGANKFFTCGDKVLRINSYIYDGPAIIISGNGSYTGRTQFFKGKFDLYQRTYACTIKENVREEYIYGLYTIVKNELVKKISGGTHGSAIPYIVMNDLAKFKIYFDEKKLEKISLKSKVILEKIQANEEENQNLEQLRDTLLPKLMNGEIDLDKIEI